MLTIDQYQAWLETRPEATEGLHFNKIFAHIMSGRSISHACRVPLWITRLAWAMSQERGSLTKARALALLAKVRAELEG